MSASSTNTAPYCPLLSVSSIAYSLDDQNKVVHSYHPQLVVTDSDCNRLTQRVKAKASWLRSDTCISAEDLTHALSAKTEEDIPESVKEFVKAHLECFSEYVDQAVQDCESRCHEKHRVFHVSGDQLAVVPTNAKQWNAILTSSVTSRLKDRSIHLFLKRPNGASQASLMIAYYAGADEFKGDGVVKLSISGPFAELSDGFNRG